MKTHQNCLFILLSIILLCAGCANPPALHASGPQISLSPSSAVNSVFVPPSPAISGTPSLVSHAAPAISPALQLEPVYEKSSASLVKLTAFAPFNEENFKKYFPFNITMRDAEKELESYKIAITDIFEGTDDADEPTNWDISTDQFDLCFDKKKRLCEVFMESDTAKGLQQGDSVDRLHELYGKENDLDIDYDGYQHYIYKRNGYKFAVAFSPKGIALGWWVVYLNRVESPF